MNRDLAADHRLRSWSHSNSNLVCRGFVRIASASRGAEAAAKWSLDLDAILKTKSRIYVGSSILMVFLMNEGVPSNV